MDIAPRIESTPGADRPLIITCAITGDQNKANNPNLPVTLDEQTTSAKAAVDAGASIIHIHARRPGDPDRNSDDPERYREINESIRAVAPGALLDNTQMTIPAPDIDGLIGGVSIYTPANLNAGPDFMSLNPGPMTFRGGETPSRALVTTFDDTARTASLMRERVIKPQIFIYHPGHLDILHDLLDRGLLAPPPFVQLVFGQQGGISATLESFLSLVRNLPPGCEYQTCALGLAAFELNALAILCGGHVRTGMEDTLVIRPDEPVESNAQLVNRIVRFASEIGRPIATPEQSRQILGMSPPN